MLTAERTPFRDYCKSRLISAPAAAPATADITAFRSDEKRRSGCFSISQSLSS
ncbi:MAG: hypothetical protein PUH20_03285 [Eubacterium sp.]|nr:hypothetical protein [Eubacterium sp.]